MIIIIVIDYQELLPKSSERTSMWEQMTALTRLPGDMNRKDLIAVSLDSLTMVQALPLPWPIPMMIGFIYRAVKLLHPAYWWLFPGTKPSNLKWSDSKKN
ncbi:uncharacterized protein isoform X2 [Leptinotarsa decemlineata]|uniref:uncharacterized protein isoform X2 n=1 Tax=Leptinotarsa decemlineata TaxID=7539 RepID=UPI003D309952